MKLQQSQQAAATYKDILMSNPSIPISHRGPHGPHLGTHGTLSGQSGPAPLPPAPALAATVAPPPLANLGPIVSQLQALVAALAATGITINQN